MEANTESLTWKDILAEEKQKPYFSELLNFVDNERKAGKIIYPKSSDVFNAIKHTPFEKVKAVILGQDPYHGPNQAHGMCFSVQRGVPKPPSLQNIFKELESDLGIQPPNHGCLESWADQGVLLLNTVLTVQAGNAHSHANKGWEKFTDKIIQELNDKREHIVFILWGSPAQKKAAMIDPTKHYILKCPHPSPLSAHRGFFSCKHFSKTNELLQRNGIEPIDWSINN